MSRKLRIEYNGAVVGMQKEQWAVGPAKVHNELQWIATRLQMDSWTYVSNLLNEPPEARPQAQEVLLLCQ
jgi:hypothetical protein